MVKQLFKKRSKLSLRDTMLKGKEDKLRDTMWRSIVKAFPDVKKRIEYMKKLVKALE